MATTKRDWLERGLILIGEAGAPALTIERLCRELGVTKGSFYHHFGGLGDYQAALLAFFEREATLRIIELTDGQGPAARLRFLLDLAAGAPFAAEIGLRAWARADNGVRAALERIDRQRIEYVRGLCRELTGDDGRALLMARMAYAILAGAPQIIPPLGPAETRRLFDELLRLHGIGD